MSVETLDDNEEIQPEDTEGRERFVRRGFFEQE